MNETLLTAGGLNRLTEELEQLRAKRTEIADQLRRAYSASSSDLSENAEYLAAREEQALLERRIALLEQRLAAAEVTEADPTDGKVGIGEPVSLLDLDSGDDLRYHIVGVGEADPANGRISYKSPVGSALLGRSADDVVELLVPGGRRRLRVLDAS